VIKLVHNIIVMTPYFVQSLEHPLSFILFFYDW